MTPLFFIIMIITLTLSPVSAKTFTEGMLEQEKFFRENHEQYQHFCKQDRKLSYGIRNVMDAIQKLETTFARESSQEKKAVIASMLIEKESQLVRLHSDRYRLAFEKLIPLKRNLKHLKEMSEKKLVKSHSFKQINNHHYKHNTSLIYRKLSFIARHSENPHFKNKIAGMLSEHEKMYKQNEKNIRFYRKFLNRVDSFDAKLTSNIEKCRLKKELLKQHKQQLEMTINLMKNDLILQPIDNILKNLENHDMMQDFDPQTNVNYLLNTISVSSDDDVQIDPKVINPRDHLLEEYSKGPKFLE